MSEVRKEMRQRKRYRKEKQSNENAKTRIDFYSGWSSESDRTWLRIEEKERKKRKEIRK